jgi:hypothetical protein
MRGPPLARLFIHGGARAPSNPPAENPPDEGFLY